jgi:hypothetical protein
LFQQGHWSFRYYEERVTEEAVSPRAGQRPGKLALKGLARFSLNDNFCHWTGDPEKKAGLKPRSS